MNILRIKSSLFICLLSLAVLSPPIPVGIGLKLRPEFIIILLIFVAQIATSGCPAVKNKASKWFGLVAVAITLSILNGELFLDQSSKANDFYEIIKIFVYYAIYYITIGNCISYNNFNRVHSSILIIFIVSAICGILQHCDLFKINDYLTPLYTQSQLQGVVIEGRAVGTTSNPNDFGILMLMGVCLSSAFFNFTKSLYLQGLNILTLTLCAVALLLSISRTVLIVAMLPFIYISFRSMLITSINRVSIKQVGKAVMILVGIIILVLPLLSDNWYQRMSGIQSYEIDEGLQGRILNWKNHWIFFEKSPLLGIGPGKDLISYNIDNEWLLLLFRYGLIGVTVFICFGRSLYSVSADIIGQITPPRIIGLNLALQAYLLSAALYMITAGVYHQQQLMTVYLLLLGLGHSAYRSAHFGHRTR